MAREEKLNDEVKRLKILKYGIIGFIILFVIACALIIVVTQSRSYVAKVGGVGITVDEFKFFLKQEKDYMLSLGNDENLDAETFWNTKINGEYPIDIARKRALENARQFKIQILEAKRKNIELTEEEKRIIDASLESSIPQGYTSTNDINRYFIEQTGVDYKSMRDILKGYSLISKLQKQSKDEMELTEEEIQKYYDENKRYIDEVTVRHILLYVREGATEEEAKAQEDKAYDLLTRINNGEDFAQLAKEYSDDPGSRDNGGIYTFSRGYMVQEFEDWSFSHNPGDTGVIKTNLGYHVMKLEEKKESLEELRDKVINLLKNKKYDEMVNNWQQSPEYALKTNDKVYESIQ